MTIASPKALAGIIAVPKSRSSIVVTVGGLAAFLVVASFLLVSYPINSPMLKGYYQEESVEKEVVKNGEQRDTRSVVSRRDSPVGGKQDIVIVKEPTASGYEGSPPGPGGEKKEIDGSDASVSQSSKLKNVTGGGRTEVRDSNSAPSEISSSRGSSREKGVEVSDSSVSKNGNGVAEIDKNVSKSESSEIHDDKSSAPAEIPSSGGKKEAMVSDGNRDSSVKKSSENGASDVRVTPVVDGSSNGTENVRVNDGSVSQNSTGLVGSEKTGSEKASLEVRNVEASGSDGAAPVSTSPPLTSNTKVTKAGSSCDLFQGKWIYDPAGPLYTNNSCPLITQMQNCQGNGRPDKDYENYRWSPHKCNLPRFNPRKFLELMRGKTIAFVGDSVARNEMESLLCILWQVEVPKNRGNRRMQKWQFKSTNTMVARIWSSWLVHTDSESFQFAPKGITKVFLDIPDETFMNYLLTFDVVVLSSGHWFAKQSAYVLNNNIVGGQLWWPKDAGPMKVNSAEAFGISVETIMTAIANHTNFTGLAILRSYSPDHYEGGAWNTGGSCTGKIKPLDEVLRNGFTDFMHDKQMKGFDRAVDKSKNGGAKLRLMDITEAFSYRADGHPGPYRNPDPNKKTKRGPHGEPPPQDCLHWCMPGPVDTWNEILLEVIRREFEGE